MDLNKSVCGIDCQNCGHGKNAGCKGCNASGGCPFGKQCFIYRYIKAGGEKSFKAFKNVLMEEFNALNIDGMPQITELYPLSGESVNLAYPLPSGQKVKLLDDKELYLRTQVECMFNDGTEIKCFCLADGMDFLLVSECCRNCSSPEIIVFEKR